jgi:hypothetical protein
VRLGERRQQLLDVGVVLLQLLQLVPERLLLERLFGDEGVFLPNRPFYRSKLVVEPGELGLLGLELLVRRVVGSLP